MTPGVFGSADDVVSRRSVRHALLRARNGRIVESRDDRWPLALHLSPATYDELAVDGDPGEAQTMDALAGTFLGIALLRDPRLPAGQFSIVWPQPVERPGIPAPDFTQPIAGRKGTP